MKGLKGALMFAQSGGPTSVINARAAGVFIEVLNSEMIPEVYGARLSGGGFGGSCCLLVKPEAADKIASAITEAYKTAYGDEPTCALIKPSEGARLV